MTGGTPSIRTLVRRVTGRADGATRSGRTLMSTGAGIGSRVVGILISLLTVRIAIGYLGPDLYGIWATLSALILMLAFADLGIGNGLVNLLATSNATDDAERSREVISSAFGMITAIAFGLGLMIAAPLLLMDWAGLLGAPASASSAEVTVAVIVFALAFLVGLPLSVATKAILAYQESYWNHAWTTAAAILSLGALVSAVALDLGLAGVVVALAGIPALVVLAQTIWLFGWLHPEARPRLSSVRRTTMGRLIRLGGLYFVLQLVVSVAFQADVVVASAVVGPSGAAEYNIMAKLFLLAPQFVAVAVLPLWPAYTEAVQRGDSAWVRHTLKVSVLATLGVVSAISVVLFLTYGWILQVWIRGAVEPNAATAAGFAIWAVVMSVGTAISILLNSMEVVKFQVVVATLMAVVSVGLSIMLGRAIGVAGVIWGTLIAYVVMTGIPLLFFMPRLLREIDGRQGTVELGAHS